MKKANAFVLLIILSLLLVSFTYINNDEYDFMLTRHDKDQAEFIKLAEKFEKYICHLNLPDCEGTVIADNWAITAAHCAVIITEKFESGKKHFVIINDEEIEVDKIIMHKDWENPEENSSSLNDIALIHLKTKPLDVKQAKLYLEEDEVDKLIYMIGRGDKGNGLIGVNGNDGKQRGTTNRIETATGNWLTFTFDHPDAQTKYLTEYEGISGPGDSGGPAFIVKDDIVYLAGVSSWQDTKGGDEGLYGVVENYTRVSQYIHWINKEITGKGDNSETMLRVRVKPNAIDDRPKTIDLNPETLKQYLGKYKMQEVTIKIYTEKNGSKIYFFVADQPPYQIVPTAQHKFAFKLSKEYFLEFKNIENGVFKELIVTQPDGKYTAIRE